MIKKKIQLTKFQIRALLDLNEKYSTSIEQFIDRSINKGVSLYDSSENIKNIFLKYSRKRDFPPFNLGNVTIMILSRIYDSLSAISKELDIKKSDLIRALITIGILSTEDTDIIMQEKNSAYEVR